MLGFSLIPFLVGQFLKGAVYRLGDEPTIHCSGYGGDAWTQPYADWYVMKEGDKLELGDARLEFLHTPGHTPEHICIALKDMSRSAEVPWMLFTGDFLFVGDVGRPDFGRDTDLPSPGVTSESQKRGGDDQSAPPLRTDSASDAPGARRNRDPQLTRPLAPPAISRSQRKHAPNLQPTLADAQKRP